MWHNLKLNYNNVHNVNAKHTVFKKLGKWFLFYEYTFKTKKIVKNYKKNIKKN